MNILFITDLYPVKSDEKTTPRTLLAFVEEWKKMGHNVDILKPNFILNSFLRGKPFYKSGQYEDVFNINYWTPFWFDVKRKFNGNSRLGTLAQLNKHNYNIVVAHMPSGILFADKLGLPFVAGIHNSDIEVLTNPLYKIHFKPRLEKALKNAGFKTKTYVNGDPNTILVKDQTPKPGISLAKNSIIILYGEGSSISTSVTVPDLKGMNASEATSALRAKNLNISIEGSGTVITQDYSKDDQVEEGTAIKVTLKQTLTDAH